ncbi:MAG: Mur ligase family protein [Gemmatimonadales bacterium]
MELCESRRLTGPNILLDGPGAVIDVETRGAAAAEVEGAWRRHAQAALEAVGWADSELRCRRFPGGVTLAFSAPEDVLYAATQVNEWAWEAARAELGDAEAEPESLEKAAERLRAAIEEERNPRLIALRDAAQGRDVTFLTDDDVSSVGMGRGCRLWPTSEVPLPEQVDWGGVRDVPVALVTGTNGKTTTVRLLTGIARAAGVVPGCTSTDGIIVGDRVVDEDDWAGPGGARQVLRRPDVEVGILETARGGILRRGLGVPRADAALVTNVAEDHLGEYGVDDLDALADTKLVVARVVHDGGRVVLNAEDDVLVAAVQRAMESGLILTPLTWFSLDARHPRILRHLESGGDACALRGGELVLWQEGRRVGGIGIDDVPIALGGAASFNVRNALAALGVAAALGWPLAAIATGLSALGGTAADNPGRLNLFELDGVKVLVDFAHNPHGMAALVQVAREISAERRLIVLGQAGDRDEASIRGLVRAAWEAAPDLVIIKEMRKYLRGQEEGVVPAIIEAELRDLGAPADAMLHTDSELDAVRTALQRARSGDLVLLTIHSDRGAVLELVSGLQQRGWSPGDALD